MASTTQISGTSVANASIKIYANGTEITSAATTANSSGAWTATIPAQAVGVVITAKAQAGSNTISVASNAVTVIADSSSGGGSGTITDTPSEKLTGSSGSKQDYLLIIALLLFLVGLFVFFKKKSKVGIALIVLAIIAIVLFLTKK